MQSQVFFYVDMQGKGKRPPSPALHPQNQQQQQNQDQQQNQKQNQDQQQNQGRLHRRFDTPICFRQRATTLTLSVARWVHNSAMATFSEAPYNAGRPNFPGPV